MKKFLSGIFAVVLAISATAFTAPHQKASANITYDWQEYVGGSATSHFVTGKTKTQMQGDYQDCNGDNAICFRQWNLGHTVPNDVYLKKL